MDQIHWDTKRLIVGNFYREHRNEGKLFTVRYFLRLGLKKTTIYGIIRRVENSIPLERKSGQGRKAVKMPKNKQKKLCRKFDGKKGVSQQKQALRFGITKQYVGHILKKYGINYLKRQPKPKSTNTQKVKQKKD